MKDCTADPLLRGRPEGQKGSRAKRCQSQVVDDVGCSRRDERGISELVDESGGRGRDTRTGDCGQGGC